MGKFEISISMKAKIRLLFLFVFLFVACGPKSNMATPASTSNFAVEPAGEESALTRQSYDHQCKLTGYESLADFYPNIYYSPNMQLSFALCEDYSESKTYYPFMISRVSGEQPEDIHPILFAPDWISKFPSTTFKPDLWHENILIFRAYILPCPDYFFCVYQDGDALYKVDLENGEFSILLPPQSTSYAFSISPDGKYLGYVYHGKPEAIYIRDLASGEENQIVLTEIYERVGSFVWTPDSKEILFFGISYTNGLFYSSLFLYDTVNSSLSLLLDHHSGTYFSGDLSSNSPEYWHQPDVLYLGAVDSPHLYINIRTREINQAP